MTTSLVDATPSVETTLQHVYRIDLDDEAWLTGLREALEPRPDEHSVAVLFRERPEGASLLAMSGSARAMDVLSGIAVPNTGDAMVLRMSLREPAAITQSNWMGMYPLPPLYAEAYRRFERTDALAIGGTSPCGVGVGIGTLLEGHGRLTKRATRYWTSVATHMTAAARLRTALHAPSEAVLSLDGNVLHAEGIARDKENREALRRATKAIDRARRGIDDAVIAIESCSAMVEGRWTLVDEFESDGRRHLIARVNEPKTPEHSGLSLRERQVITLAINGRATKQIAYELGIAVPTVASYLRRSIRKLGMRSRLELVAKGLVS